MIIPLPLIGLALAGRALFLKNSSPSLNQRSERYLTPKRRGKSMPIFVNRKSRPMPNPFQNFINGKNRPVINPFQNLINGLKSSVSKFTQKSSEDDYDSIIKSYMPENARILTPLYPVHTKSIQLTDLDGDSQKELITSYKLNDEITTMVLKKQAHGWEKAAEIRNSNNDSINFMSFADIQGLGKKQLFIGYKTREGSGELHCYSLDNETANELFTQNYNRVEILLPSGSSRASSKAQLAIWDTSDMNRHSIDVKYWNGSYLESASDQSSYYFRRVLPYYAQKVKRTPGNSSNWYNLANALSKSGMYEDGISALEFGMRQNPTSPSVEEFMTLKEEILDKRKYS